MFPEQTTAEVTVDTVVGVDVVNVTEDEEDDADVVEVADVEFPEPVLDFVLQKPNEGSQRSAGHVATAKVEQGLRVPCTTHEPPKPLSLENHEQ